jgi:hypothetical protein
MWLTIEFELHGSKLFPIIQCPCIPHVAQALLCWLMIIGPIMWVEIEAFKNEYDTI